MRIKRLMSTLLALAVIATACGGAQDETNAEGRAEEEVTLTFTSYGGAYQEAQRKAHLEPYMEANPNVTIIEDEPVDYAQIQAMVESGNVTWDVANVGNDFGLARNEDILEPIDCDVVPCDELQPDEFPTTGYRVPIIFWSMVMGYRTDAWDGREPQGWEDFFDTENFPGTRTMERSGTSGNLEAALLADGVSPDELYPLDVERALAKLDEIKDDIIFWEVGQQCAQMLADNEAQMGICYNGRVFDVQQDGAPVAVQWNGAMGQADYLVVPKGAPNVEASMELIAYMVSAEHNARISDYIPYAPPNENARDDVNPDMEEHLPTTHVDQAVFPDDMWLDENFDELANRFLEWVQE